MTKQEALVMLDEAKTNPAKFTPAQLKQAMGVIMSLPFQGVPSNE